MKHPMQQLGTGVYCAEPQTTHTWSLPFAFFDLQPVKPAANDAITCPELAQKHGSRLLLDPILALTVLPFLQGYPFVLAKPLHPLA